MNDELGLFYGKEKPTREIAWSMYQQGVDYNNRINLADTVKANENFYIGKQWEGVITNGLPTPQVNFIKRVTGFTIAQINSDNIKLIATPYLAAANDEELIEPVRVLNEELQRTASQVHLARLTREMARDAAVRGDGCIYSWWDPDAPTGQKAKGAVRAEIVENTRVFFGNPADRRVQDQPYIMISKREPVRKAKLRARNNGCEDWRQIISDDDMQDATDSVKRLNNLVTTVMCFWKDEETGDVWAYEFCHASEIRRPWKVGIRLYPIVWLNWDYVADSYHGQAMVTGLIPNQIFINKAWAMSMMSIMRSAWPKTIYDRTRISHWDNRVGGAIGVNGNVDNVARILDPAQVSPQVFQYISAIIQQSEESMGATSAALGEGKAYNTSAILSLQKAAATPNEMTKHNMHEQDADLGRIWTELYAENMGKRMVDMPIPDKVRKLYEKYNAEFASDPMSEVEPLEIPERITTEFDFSVFKDFAANIEIDAGAGTYFSDLASMQTLDNLLLNNRIDTITYLEHIPDTAVVGRQDMIAKLKQAEEAQKEQQAMLQAQQMMEAGGPTEVPEAPVEEEAPATGEISESPVTEERRSTGFRELQKALRRIQ